MLADSYRSKDHLFVETKAFNELKTVVEEMHWATLLGKPGDGKSATAAHLLLQYTDRGYDPVFLSSPRDWKMLISDSPSSRQVVMIDDMFGQSYLDDNNNVGKWKSLIENMSRIVKQMKGNLVVICTSRRYIFKDIETSLSKHACFLKHSVVDMTEEHFRLTGDEKVAMFKKFAEAYLKETCPILCNIRYVDPPHGFPHCVELYCTNAFLRKDGIAFFRNPVQFVKREICNFKENDRVKFLVLLLVLHKGEGLCWDAFDRLTENTTDDDKKFFQTAGVSVETAIPDIQRALNGLTNTYLKQNEDGSYSFSHHSLRETVAFVYISANPSHAIRALEFKHIVAYTNTQKDTTNPTISKISLPLEPLAKRIILEVQAGHVFVVCDLDVWKDVTFVSKFLKYVESDQRAFLETIFCRESETNTSKIGLLVGLILKRLYEAATKLVENEPIGKVLQNSDRWKRSLEVGLEKTCLVSKLNITMIKALLLNCDGENRLKLDGSQVLFNMLCLSAPNVANCLIEHAYINPGYRYFHALAVSTIHQPVFGKLCHKLIDTGVDINQTDEDGIPAVFKCLTRFGDNGCNRLSCMVTYGANIHKHCKYGNIVTFFVNNANGFRYSFLKSSKSCVNMLVKLSEFDVDFQCTDNTGSNAIHLMCEMEPDKDSNVLLEYLLDKGVAPEALNNDGVNPLMLALTRNYSIDIIRILAKNSSPNHVDKSGKTYFHYLMCCRSIADIDEFCDKCEILLKLGASINGTDNADKSPIVYLIEKCRISNRDLVKLFQFLHDNGIDLHAKDGHGRNIVLCVLDWKLTENVLPVLDYFESIGLDLKLTDSIGRNALHHLFANAVYIDNVVEKEMVANHYNECTEREFPEVCGNMLKKIYEFLKDDIGVLPTIRDKNGINPVMLALKNCAGFSWISELLKLDLPLQSDDKGRNYCDYLAQSRAPDDKFETLKTMLLDKGLTVHDYVLRNRPKPLLWVFSYI